MRIERGKVVSLSYELRDRDGQPLEDDGAQMAYLHGYGGIFPKVEEALQGKDVGAEAALTLEPLDAFGEYDAELLRVEPRDRFPETLEVGMRFEGVPGESEEEGQIYTVTDIAAQVWIQCKGVGFTVIYTAIVTFIILKVLDAVMGLRVTEEEEREGLDISSHGESAYRI